MLSEKLNTAESKIKVLEEKCEQLKKIKFIIIKMYYSYQHARSVILIHARSEILHIPGMSDNRFFEPWSKTFVNS